MSVNFEESSLELNFENLFKIINISLKTSLSHPKMKRDFRWFCKFSVLYGHFLSVFLLLIYSIVFHDLKNNDSTQACANGILCVVYFVVTFDYCVLFSYRKILRELIDRMDSDYKVAKTFSDKEQTVVLNYIRKGQGVAKLWFIIATCGCILFVVKQIVLTMYYIITSEFRVIHLYELRYPDAVEEVKDNFIIYCILYIYFLLYDLTATVIFIGFSPMGSIFMLHACGQLEIAQNRILGIFYENNSSEVINRKLKEVATFLNSTYRFIDNLQLSFKLLYELSLKSTTLVVPVTFYQILEETNSQNICYGVYLLTMLRLQSETIVEIVVVNVCSACVLLCYWCQSFKTGDFRVEFITIIIGGMTLSSIPCYYSDTLMEAGEKLRLSVYACGWETHFESKSRIMILMLLLRTSRPVAIRTLFRVVCLDALTDVFHQAYAIFNVLNAAWN